LTCSSFVRSIWQGSGVDQYGVAARRFRVEELGVMRLLVVADIGVEWSQVFVVGTSLPCTNFSSVVDLGFDESSI